MDDDSGSALPALIEAAWGVRARPGKGPKPGLSLERIVQAAIRVAARDGLGAVSMSRVAGELGASTMSLYRYVSAKDELVKLMVDAAYGPPPAAGTPDEGWRGPLSRWAWAVRGNFRRHRWAGSASWRAVRPWSRPGCHRPRIPNAQRWSPRPAGRPSGRAGSPAGESRRALLGEGRDPLGEVVRAGHLPLELRLELELGLHALIEPPVELALGAPVGPGRAGREPADELVGPRRDLIVRPDPVHQPPLQPPPAPHPLAHHR